MFFELQLFLWFVRLKIEELWSKLSPKSNKIRTREFWFAAFSNKTHRLLNSTWNAWSDTIFKLCGYRRASISCSKNICAKSYSLFVTLSEKLSYLFRTNQNDLPGKKKEHLIYYRVLRFVRLLFIRIKTRGRTVPLQGQWKISAGTDLVMDMRERGHTKYMHRYVFFFYIFITRDGNLCSGVFGKTKIAESY